MDLKKLSSLLVAGSALWIAPVSIGWAQNADDVNPLPEASPLVQEPKTPVEEFDAVLMMLRLGKPELARYYLQQLLDGEPDDATMLQLRDRHDTATFLELIRVPQLEADAKKLADRLQTAIRNHVNDPGYFSQLVKKLSGSSRDRAEAIDEMRYLGPYAVPPLLLELQNPQQTNKGDLVYALTRLRSTSRTTSEITELGIRTSADPDGSADLRPAPLRREGVTSWADHMAAAGSGHRPSERANRAHLAEPLADCVRTARSRTPSDLHKRVNSDVEAELHHVTR